MGLYCMPSVCQPVGPAYIVQKIQEIFVSMRFGWTKLSLSADETRDVPDIQFRPDIWSLFYYPVLVKQRDNETG